MRSHIKAFLLHDFLKAGGAGYIYLGKAIADDIEPGEQNAAPHQFGRERFGDFAVARAQFLRYAPAACRQIAAGFAFLRNPCQRKEFSKALLKANATSCAASSSSLRLSIMPRRPS